MADRGRSSTTSTHHQHTAAIASELPSGLKGSRSSLFLPRALSYSKLQKINSNATSTKTPLAASASEWVPETPLTPVSANTAAQQLVLRVSYPALKLQKAIRVATGDLVWTVMKQAVDKGAQDVKDSLNYGIFLPGINGKPGMFLDDKREIGSYSIENNTNLEFLPKTRTMLPGMTESEFRNANSKKELKKFIEDIKSSNLEKVKERLNKGLDPNFRTETQETPLSIAITNNEKGIVAMLIENGAFLDYRIGDLWKTPLHLIAENNKSALLQALISYGAWTNATDSLGLTPLYYAATAGHIDIVIKLLSSKANPEVYDDHGKGPLHQACLNNHDIIASLLLDSAANMNASNEAGNTPLHVAATRNAIECAKWLLMRGCDREKSNKSGQTPAQAALFAGNSEIAELIKNFKASDIVPPPPKVRVEDEADMPMSLPANYPNVRFINLAPTQQLSSTSHVATSESSTALEGGSPAIPAGVAPVLNRQKNTSPGASSTLSGRPAGLGEMIGSQASVLSIGASPTLRGRLSSHDLKSHGISRSPSLIPEDSQVMQQQSGLLARLNSLKRRKKFDSIVVNGITVPPPPAHPPTLSGKVKKSGSQASISCKIGRRKISSSSLVGGILQPSPSARALEGSNDNGTDSTAPVLPRKSHASRPVSVVEVAPTRPQSASILSLHTVPVVFQTPEFVKSLIAQCTNGGSQQDVEMDMDTLVEGFKSMESMLMKANEQFAAVDVELKRLRDERSKLVEEVDRLKRKTRV
ncbi:hypothetical protein SeMB42_g00571 [Synchytrium endobioticum]|uniref:Talin N-terminal F0 domain-containing protein n=1 Tax=Synchytrium endobioticum TaxID=286115 RepID=A0A507DEG3_9FUNG|nr:hypothetical protein SeLEV6574_g01148 [Synchytrium endobioticum]TPX53913.1 hypothetical protein SeMB42_g00571 [Synchytrium endobioticum]